jgi:hypothetical protein
VGNYNGFEVSMSERRRFDVGRFGLAVCQPLVIRALISTGVSAATGAATSVYAATAPELEGRGGLYLEDCHVAEVDDAENAPHGVKSYAIDPGVAQQLWVASEEMVGERVDLL